VAGQPVTFTAVVTNLDSSGPAPTGTVTFKDVTYQGTIARTNTLAAALHLTNGMAAVATSALAAGGYYLGSHFITATYSGDSAFPSGSATLVQKVHQSATVTTLSSSGAVPGSNTVTFTATVASSPAGTNKPTGMVSFWDGPAFLAQLALNTNGVGAFTNSSLVPGSHSITANYYSD